MAEWKRRNEPGRAPGAGRKWEREEKDGEYVKYLYLNLRPAPVGKLLRLTRKPPASGRGHGILPEKIG